MISILALDPAGQGLNHSSRVFFSERISNVAALIDSTLVAYTVDSEKLN